jgi:hypothetical protein
MSIWDERYAELVRYKEEHGHSDIPQKYSSNPKLGLWVRAQRVYKRQGKLPFEKIELLDQQGFKWEARVLCAPRGTWEDRYDDLTKYKKLYGHPNVPSESLKYSTLARWLILQRTLQKQGKLLEWKEDLLKRLNIDWGKCLSNPQISWEKHFDQLLAFKEKYRHCSASMGDTIYGDLGRWLAAERAKKAANILDFDKFEKLAFLGFGWVKDNKEYGPLPFKNRDKKLWNEMYQLLIQHKQQFGDCDFKKNPPINKHLFEWAKIQRELMASGCLEMNAEILLNKAGFIWIYDSKELNKYFRSKFTSRARNRPRTLAVALLPIRLRKKRSDECWGNNFSSLFDFKKTHGDLDVPYQVKAFKGLYEWFQKQKRLKKSGKLASEREKLLFELGAFSR